MENTNNLNNKNIIGISTASLFNRVPTESAFDILKQMQVGITEVFLSSFSEYEESFITALAKKKGGMKVHSVHALGTQFEPELFSINSRVRNDAEAVFKRVCNAGKILGASYYTFHGPMHLKKTKINLDFIRLGDRINQLNDIAKSYNIQISYENVHWAFGSNPEYFKNILKVCPNLPTTLDIKQSLLANINPVKFLDVMGENISTIHLCDLKNKITTAIPGKGNFDFEKFFSQVAKRKINAPMFLEVYPKDYGDLKELKTSFKYLQAIN